MNDRGALTSYLMLPGEVYQNEIIYFRMKRRAYGQLLLWLRIELQTGASFNIVLPRNATMRSYQITISIQVGYSLT